MNRLVHEGIAALVMVVLVGGCGTNGAAGSGQKTAEAPPVVASDTAEATPVSAPETAEGQSKFIPPIRGEAEVGVLPPVTKVDNKLNMVITTIKVKNLSGIGSIAGLKVEEYWWDKANNPVTGSKARLAKPLLPGEEATLTLETPKDPKMHRNNYQFSHANGKIKTKPMKAF